MIFLQRDESHAADVRFDGDAARILKDGVVVRDWTVGGVIEDLPQGAGYTLEVMKGGKVAVDTVAVGIVVGTIGQSNMSFWNANGDAAAGVVAAAPDTFRLSNGEWKEVAGDANRTFANYLAANTGAPVAIVDGSLGSTSLLAKYTNANGNWEATGPGSLYGKFLSKLDAVGGSAEIILWIQGENDARAGASVDEYLAGLNNLFARLRADVEPSAILGSKLGNSIYGDPLWAPFMTMEQAARIREAQTSADSAHDDVTFVDAVDLGLQDVIHRTTVSSATEAVRLADAYLSKIGITPTSPISTGTEQEDSFTGSEGMDVIEAGGGDDRVEAGGGGDLVLGGNGSDTIDGGEGNDLLSGGDGDDVIQGGNGDDRITGDTGNDRIDGGAGNDVVTGGEGSDEIRGGAGNDTLDGGLGDDTIFGDGGNDLIRLSGGNDRIEAGEGNDTIMVENYGHYNYRGASFGYSVVNGGSGYDVLRATTNDTTIALKELSGVELVTAGGHTNVRLIGSAEADVFDLRSTTLVDIVSIQTGDGDDTVFGSAANDRISAGSGDDKLTGEGGDDLLIGGTGDDIVDGGTGTDILQLVGSFAQTTIDRSQGRISNAVDGTDTISNIEFINFSDGVYNCASGTFVATPPFSGVLITGTSGNDAIGPTASVTRQPKASEFNDKIYGFGGDDRLDGGAGGDVLVGGLGNDTYIVDSAADQVVEAANEGLDIVYASTSYTLSDNVERLILTGTGAINGTGNALGNFLTGNASANTLSGGAGDDRLYGEGGADTLIGGSGNDLYYVDNSADLALEAVNEGLDTVNASASFVLSDNVENLTLTGTNAINGTGNALANTILGNSAANILSGGDGADLLRGYGGADVFRFDTSLNARQNVDTIADFVVGEDRIALDARIFTAFATNGLSAADFAIGKAATNASQNIIYDSASGKLFYDADGLGGTAQVQFATLSSGLNLNIDGFQIF